MTENLAGRGEGLAGRIAEVLEKYHHFVAAPRTMTYRQAIAALAKLLAKELEAAAPAGTAPAHDGYYLQDRWVPCKESCPACRLRNAASKFGARVFERYPDWQQETGTDLAEARDELTTALAPSRQGAGT